MVGVYHFAVTLAAVGLQPVEYLAHDQVDLIEVNHLYDEHGRLVFDQVIFYDWSPADSRFHVRAWRLLKTPAQFPAWDSRQGMYVTTWHDGDVLRRVRARSVRETWTQYDPELIERDFLPKERRREFTRIPVQIATERLTQMR